MKNVGRNKINVEFSTTLYFNLSLCKYIDVIPSFNITRMDIIRDVPLEFSLDEFVYSLEFSSWGNTTCAPTFESVVVIFRGQMLPRRVFSYYFPSSHSFHLP